MVDRRGFIAGLLSTAALPALPALAYPSAVSALDVSAPVADGTVIFMSDGIFRVFGATKAALKLSVQKDFTAWSSPEEPDLNSVYVYDETKGAIVSFRDFTEVAWN